MIKIADRSEHGWATVKEYEDDELAENSDDEKRLFRAEARAGRKTRQQKSTKSSNARKKGQYSAGSKATGAFTSRSPVGGVAEIALLQNLLSPMQTARQTLPLSGSPQLGQCFTCGKLGHIRKTCPLLQGPVQSKTL